MQASRLSCYIELWPLACIQAGLKPDENESTAAGTHTMLRNLSLLM